MSRRQWTPEEKLQIVLEGLKDKVKLSGLCNRYQISQTQYYQWKDRLLEFFSARHVLKDRKAYRFENFCKFRLVLAFL